jgi:hypothetical protein
MPEEDLILGDPEEGEEGVEEEVEMEYETSTPIDYINMSMTVMGQLENIDTALMTQVSAKRVKNMRHWAIYIAWYNMKEIYDDITEIQEDRDGQN